MNRSFLAADLGLRFTFQQIELATSLWAVDTVLLAVYIIGYSLYFLGLDRRNIRPFASI